MVTKQDFSKDPPVPGGVRKTIDLKALSRKKYPTGRELGILEIERMCEAHKASMFEGYRPKSVIPDINRFMEKLDRLDPRGEAEYSRYIELHHWIVEENNDAYYNTAAAERGIADLQAIWTQKITAEETLQFLTPTRPDVRHAVLDAMPTICRTSTPLDELFDEAGEWTEDAREVEATINDTRDMIAGRIYRVNAYNYAIERIAVILDVPDVVVFKIPLEMVTERLKRYNKSIKDLEDVVKKSYEPARARKTEAVKRIAKPITARTVGSLDESTKTEMDRLITTWRGFMGGPPLSGLFSKPRRGGGNRKGTGKGSAEE